MIKVNLSTAKKQVDISNVGGIDFTKVKIKALLLVMIIIYIPDYVLSPIWEEERTTAQQVADAKQAELSTLKRKVAQSQELEKQIKELKAQEENLGKKLVAVKEAISEKKSPAPLLLFIAKNTPNELWITELTIDAEKMVIKGEALDYSSIGTFVGNLKSSVFIREANIGSTNSEVRKSDNRRIEKFEVTFTIASFNQ